MTICCQRRSAIYPGHIPAASALTRLFLGSFRFHTALMAAGERLTHPLGMTAARWQVLSTVARADRPETVANIGRLMGLTRQAVQRIVNDLVSGGLLRAEMNPHHKRAVLVRLTPAGKTMFEQMTARQVAWANELADELCDSEIEQAVAVIARVTAKLEAKVGETPKP
ncbi:MAG: winged helix-turn-helix transcriptional regulator [Sphingopyxis sp.]|nr:winged helix-turn-helix transcriptional regulator [Sphingopyxis sp.]